MPRIQGTLVAPGFYRPLLPVSLHVQGRTPIIAGALIDSGADWTIVPFTLIKNTGIRFEELPLLSKRGEGAGGSFEIRECLGEVKWRQWVVCTKFLVGEPGKFESTPLLGREDFFKRFVVRFLWHKDPPSFDIDPAR